jgi:hypothetical protein
MRRVVASALVLFLMSVAALCPALACAPTPSSCCHKPARTVPDCPYSILEKSKTNPAATHANWVGSIAWRDTGVMRPVTGLTVNAPCRLVDAAGLFLRNHVLLI